MEISIVHESNCPEDEYNGREMDRWELVDEAESKLVKFIAERGASDSEIIQMNAALELIVKYFRDNELYVDDLRATWRAYIRSSSIP